MVNQIKDLEKDKFYKNAAGESVVRVGLDTGMIPGVQYDTISASYPNSTTEIYIYSLSGDTQATITVTYTDATKDNINTVVRT